MSDGFPPNMYSNDGNPNINLALDSMLILKKMVEQQDDNTDAMLFVSKASKIEKKMKRVTLSDFKSLGFVAKGAFGSVIKAVFSRTNEVLALKKIQKFSISSVKMLFKEKEFLLRLSDDWTPSLHSCIESKSNVYLAMEYFKYGSLASYKSSLPKSVAVIYFVEVGLAIEYLHKNDIVHRDLKALNILIDNQCHIKIADFGRAEYLKKNDVKFQKCCGTPGYNAPEATIAPYIWSQESDNWSYGVLFYEIFHPYNQTLLSMAIDTTDKEIQEKTTSNEFISSRLTRIPDEDQKKCLSMLLQQKPKDRKEISSILTYVDILKPYDLMLESIKQVDLSKKLKYLPERAALLNSAPLSIKHSYDASLRSQLRNYSCFAGFYYYKEDVVFQQCNKKEADLKAKLAAAELSLENMTLKLQNSEAICREQKVTIERLEAENMHVRQIPNTTKESSESTNFEVEEDVQRNDETNSPKRGFQCGLCRKIYKHRQSLAQHQKTGHAKEKVRRFKCSFKKCGKSYMKSSSLKIHMNLHQKLKPYACHSCGSKYHHPELLKKHIRKEHGQ